MNVNDFSGLEESSGGDRLLVEQIEGRASSIA